MMYTNVNYTMLLYHIKATVYTEPAAFVVTNKLYVCESLLSYHTSFFCFFFKHVFMMILLL